MSDEPNTPEAHAGRDYVELMSSPLAEAESITLMLQAHGIDARCMPGSWTIAGPSDRASVLVPRAKLELARQRLADEAAERENPATSAAPASPDGDDDDEEWKWPIECPRCQYSLDGLRGVELCPECGQNVLELLPHDDIVELTSAGAVEAQVIAAGLEGVGIPARIHELLALQAGSTGVWRVFVFKRDLERAQRELPAIKSAEIPVEPVQECPACGHEVGGLAVPRCPECGLAFDTSAKGDAPASEASEPELAAAPITARMVRGPRGGRGGRGAKAGWVFVGIAVALFATVFALTVLR